MAKKHKPEEHENHERWLVSYADFITLLFAFFVVMYAISSVNEGKFRVVSQSIVEALNPMINLSASNIKLQPESAGGPTSARAISIDMQIFRKLTDALRSAEAPKTGKALSADRQALAGQPAQTGPQVAVAQDERGVVVSISNAVAFKPGRAELLPEARAMLIQVAAALKEFPNHVRVEGHTDSVPIRTEQYPSNWELSAARAVNIVRFLTEGGHLPPERLAAAGYGEFHPVAENGQAEGRAANRRVELVIIKSGSPEGAARKPDVAVTSPCVPSSGFPPGCMPAAPSVQDEITRKLF